MTGSNILVLLSMICFVIAFVNRPAMPVQIGWLGLFFYVLAAYIKTGGG